MRLRRDASRFGAKVEVPVTQEVGNDGGKSVRFRRNVLRLAGQMFAQQANAL